MTTNNYCMLVIVFDEPVAMVASKKKEKVIVCGSFMLASIEPCSVVPCCDWFVLLTKSWTLCSSCQHSQSESLSRSLEQSSQQAEKNKPHSV